MYNCITKVIYYHLRLKINVYAKNHFLKNKEANNRLFLPTMPQTNYAKLNSFQVNAAENFAMGIIKDQL